MSGGGKGGSQTTRVQLPGFIEDAARQAISQGQQAAQIGFVPYTGPDVAAFSPAQEAVFAGTNAAASAFGLPTSTGTGLPVAQDFGGGIMGYSSAPIFEQQMAEFEATRPGQFAAIQDFFIDPVTGAPAASAMPRSGGGGGGAPRGVLFDDGAADDQTRGIGSGGQGVGGYTGIRDMFDGGGAGASGSRFEGGGLVSDLGNRIADRNEGGLLEGLLNG